MPCSVSLHIFQPIHYISQQIAGAALCSMPVWEFPFFVLVCGIQMVGWLFLSPLRSLPLRSSLIDLGFASALAWNTGGMIDGCHCCGLFSLLFPVCPT